MRESAIQRDILRAFAPMFLLFRQNTGAAVGPSGRIVRFGEPGQSDLWGLLPGGRYVAIEVKSETGRQSENQRRWQSIIERWGGIYVLARCPGDVWAAIEPHADDRMHQMWEAFRRQSGCE